MEVKFGMVEEGPLLHAKFDPHWCNVPPLRGDKPQNQPRVTYIPALCASRSAASNKSVEQTAVRSGVQGFHNRDFAILSIIFLQQMSSNCQAPFTRYNLLSNRLLNRFDNRVYRVYSWLSNRLYNPV